MSTSIFKFSEVEAKKASPQTLRQGIKDVIQADNDACWMDMEPYLIPPGVAGSREYDHAYAVDVLLKHDAKHGGRIFLFMESNRMPRRMVWDEVVKVCRQVGFRFHNGRLVGLLEDKSNENGSDNAGADDIA